MKRKKKQITTEQIEKMEFNEDERMLAILEMVEDYLTTVDDEIYWKRKQAALKIMTQAAIFGGDTMFESLGILEEAKHNYREIYYESVNEDDYNDIDEEEE
jgi:hypothetical protein